MSSTAEPRGGHSCPGHVAPRTACCPGGPWPEQVGGDLVKIRVLGGPPARRGRRSPREGTVALHPWWCQNRTASCLPPGRERTGLPWEAFSVPASRGSLPTPSLGTHGPAPGPTASLPARPQDPRCVCGFSSHLCRTMVASSHTVSSPGGSVHMVSRYREKPGWWGWPAKPGLLTQYGILSVLLGP